MSELPGYLRRFKYPRPVLTPTKVGGDFDSLQVDCAGIIERSGRYYMTYAGWDGECTRIGLAQSKDLLHWKRVKMILGLGPEGAWDSGSVSGPFVLQHQRKYFLFYCGFPTLGYEAGPGAIGIATSTDLSNWKRHPENPILTHSPGGAWEKGGAYKPFVKRHRSLFLSFL